MLTLILLGLITAALIAAPVIIERRRKPIDDAARADAPGTFHTLTNGITHVTRKGPMRGPVVVCVHGLTSAQYVWNDIATELSDTGYRVVAYDLYGRGYSDRPKGRQDADFFLQQLDDVIATMDLPETFILMGYSMGAAISVAYAEKNPGRIDRLVLVAPAGMSKAKPGLDRWVRDTPVLGDWVSTTLGGYIRKRRYAAKTETDPKLAQINAKQLAESDYQGFLPAVLSSARHMLKTNQMTHHQRLEAERVPTLAVWGEEDQVIPMTALGNMTQANRAVIHEVIAGADHALPYTHPHEVVKAIKPFLFEG